MTSSPTTVVDARWTNKTGTTTFTCRLLEGLAALEPAGRWVLWGPPEMIRPFLWPGAVAAPTSVDPVAWFGQRSAFRLPPADLVLHPHQTRPVHRVPAASCVLDLIQLDGRYTPLRAAKAVRVAAAVRAARALFTISTSVRDQLVATFHVDPASVTVLNLPVDAAAAARVAAWRRTRPPERIVLAIGRFTPHKNHRRLVEAFSQTRFAADGGQLHLVGGTVDELPVPRPLPPGVRVLGVLDPPRLEAAMARALAVVQASLVEGYGLPVAEALTAGVPVTSSPVPAVTEYGPQGVPTFDPWSISAISAAIDETVELVDDDRYWSRVAREAWLTTRPTPRTLAEQVLAGLAIAGAAPRRGRGRDRASGLRRPPSAAARPGTARR